MGKCKFFLFFFIFFQEKIFDVSYCKILATQQCINIVCAQAKSLQLCPTLCDAMDCSPSGSSVGFSSQKYWSGYSSILEYWNIPFSRGSSQPRDRTRVSYVSCIARQAFYCWHYLGSPYQHPCTVRLSKG